jgi:hypothetical protein
VNPYGTQTVTWDGDTPTLTQTLSPTEQAIYDANARNRVGMGNLAGQGLESLMGLIGTGVDFSSAPGMGPAYAMTGTPEAFDPSTLGDYAASVSALPGAPQASEAIRRRVIDAMMSRADEDFARRQAQMDSDLVARGLRPGTEAYERERDSLNRARNDYRMQAELAGGQEADRAFGQDLSRRGQAFQELITGRGQRAGEQAQRFQQSGQAHELWARQQAQRFGQQDNLRRQAITEALARRQIPLNEITALMSGSQVSNPFSVPGYAQNTQVAPPPLFAATQAQGAWDQNAYNQRVGSFNNMMSGLFGLGSAFMTGPR